MMPIAGGPPESLIGALLDEGQGHVAREPHSMDEGRGLKLLGRMRHRHPLPINFEPPPFGAAFAKQRALPMPMEPLLAGSLAGGRPARKHLMLSGHVAESHSIQTERGPDGREHLYSVVRKCTRGDCHTSRHQLDGHPPLDRRNVGDEDQTANLPAVGIRPLAMGMHRQRPDMDELAMPFLPGLGSVLNGLLDDGPIHIPSAIQRVRLRAGPSLAGRLTAPLEHVTRDDGAEVIQGHLPKGLSNESLLVEQRGDMVLIRHILNHTINDNAKIGVEQHIRLGFQPERKEQARYSSSTGHFVMEFARPQNAEFDPRVEVLFESSAMTGDTAKERESPNRESDGPPTAVKASNAPGEADARNKKLPSEHHVSMLQVNTPRVKPDVIFEVGDEL